MKDSIHNLSRSLNDEMRGEEVGRASFLNEAI